MADNMNVTVRDPLAPRRQMPPIVIGRAGEYGATTVTFDLRGLIDRYGTGTPSLLHKRPPDDEAYIVPMSAADTETHDRTEMPGAETLVWHVGQAATSYVGNGKIELQWHPEGAAKKSAQFDVVVLGTIGNPVSEIPDAQQIYLDVMQGIADDAEDAADRAEAAVSHYPKIVNGVWFVWDAEQSKFVSTGISAQGDPGKVKSAYLDDGVVRLVEDDTIYTALLMQTDIGNGVLPFVLRGIESDSAEEYFELDHHDLSAASPVIHFRSREHLLSVDSTGHFTLTDRPQGGGSADAVLYTQQSLADAQQAQARENIGAAASADLLSMLIPILRDGIYGSDQTAAIAALETALGSGTVTTYSITNVLTNVTNDNSANTVVPGAAYSAALTPASGMDLTSVSVSMGGSDITSTAYSNGTITIATVTGDVVITAAAEQRIVTIDGEMSPGITSPNGSVSESTSYSYTQHIPVREGDRVYGTSVDSASSVQRNNLNARFTAAFDENGAAISASGSSGENILTAESPLVIPAGVYSVVFTMLNRFANNVVVCVDKSERVGA